MGGAAAYSRLNETRVSAPRQLQHHPRARTGKMVRNMLTIFNEFETSVLTCPLY